MADRLNITRGVNKKPVATDALEQSFDTLHEMQGEVFTGYPLIATPDGKEILFPAVDQFVISIDLEEGKAVIAPPPGLIELYLSESGS